MWQAACDIWYVANSVTHLARNMLACDVWRVTRVDWCYLQICNLFSSYSASTVPTFPNIDSSNISVQVFDPTRQPVSVKIGSHVTTLTGTPVTITCDVTGFPEPRVSWMKGFTSITGSDTERLIVSESRLSLLSSGVSDSDQYMCTASSPGGQAAVVSNITFVGKQW